MNARPLFLGAAALLFANAAMAQGGRREGGALLLKSGFESGVSVTSDLNRIVGSDVAGFAWDKVPGWENSRFAYIISRDSKVTDFMDTVIEKQIGPRGSETRVLRLINKADDPRQSSTSRNEFSLFAPPPPNEYQEGYVRYWMKLQSDLEHLIPADQRAPWYMIMEWKEPSSGIVKSARECKECCNAGAGGTNNYRINIGLQRDPGTAKFHWVVRGERPQPCRVEEWRHENRSVHVPLGEWFLVEGYMKKHPRDGRVYFAVNGEVVLDTAATKPGGFTGRTEHPDNPLPLRFWSPMKNYHGMEWNAKGPVSQWYDDFELWSSFPPGHPATR